MPATTIPRSSPVGRRRAFRTAALAVAAALGAASPASAGVVVDNVFRVDYEITGTYSHDRAWGPVTDHDTAHYTVRGRLPDVEFHESSLHDNVSVVLKQVAAEGGASTDRSHPEGTSVKCSGDQVTVSGLIGIGKTYQGMYVFPKLQPRVAGSCTDSDGGAFPMDFAFGLPGEQPLAPGFDAPPGAFHFKPTAAEVDVAGWSKDFRITVADGPACPDYNPEATIGCSLETAGRITFTRISRSERQIDDDILAPVEPVIKKKPKLDKKKRKAETTVECPSACDIEAIIGVFGGTKKKPRVIERRTKKAKLKAAGTRTVKVPLTAKVRAAAKRGQAAMQLKVTIAGKAHVQTFRLK